MRCHWYRGVFYIVVSELFLVSRHLVAFKVRYVSDCNLSRRRVEKAKCRRTSAQNTESWWGELTQPDLEKSEYCIGHENGLYHWWGFITAGTQTCVCTIGPSQAIPSLLIGVVLSPRIDMWGTFTNTGYIGMPTSLGMVWTLIHCHRWGSLTDKPRTRISQCPSMSVADITDCATSPTTVKM